MIKIIIADDHDIVREGIARILDMKKDIEIVGEASTGREAVRLCLDLKPDVALLDLDMPEVDGIEAAKQITSGASKTRVIILTMHDNEEYAARALSAGASGFMLKGASRGELPGAIRKVAAGGKAINPDIMEKLITRNMAPQADSPLSALSDRELQILTRIAKGLTLKEIAEDLCLGTSTVFTYKKRLKEKLNIKKDIELTRIATKHGLVEDF